VASQGKENVDPNDTDEEPAGTFDVAPKRKRFAFCALRRRGRVFASCLKNL
jgi:hypothetical protein